MTSFVVVTVLTHVTMQVGLFVAEYDTVSAKTKHGIDVSVLTPPGRGREGRFALDVGVKCLDFFTDAFKVPYPLPKCDLISVEELSAGGK
jgi:aminopeptidase N